MINKINYFNKVFSPLQLQRIQLFLAFEKSVLILDEAINPNRLVLEKKYYFL